MTSLSNQPYKGTSDWLPDEFAVRKAIFDKWREVCISYGYKEYLTPLVEPIELYQAKSGEDLGGKELMVITDRAGRKLAIRPEMTPSVTRLVSQIYESTPKPIRLFSIANFMRAEKPQRGRNREFWQLNFDIFGSESIYSDIEIIQMSIDIMQSFQPPENSYSVNINHRGIINDFIRVELDEEKKSVGLIRLMDKYEKLSSDEFEEALAENLSDRDNVEKVINFLNLSDKEELLKKFPSLSKSKGLDEIDQIVSQLAANGYDKMVIFKPNLVRGLDYYDGMVFELFDNHKKNNRSLFGGGRYNSLSDLFGSSNIPAVGVAPGDETLRLFIESWGLVKNLKLETDERVFLPILDESLINETFKVAEILRERGMVVSTGLEVMKIGKAISYADKNNYTHVALLGSQEFDKGVFLLKNLSSGDSQDFELK